MRRAALAPAAVLAAALLGAPAAGAQAPSITARAAIVVEASTGEVVYARRADRPRPIASTTKLMTALVTLEDVSLRDRLAAPRYRAGPAETRINLRPGERMRVSDLLRAMLLPSANDAAATLAEGVAGSRSAFVTEMNRRAAALGLRNTRFANPIGLDEPGNRSSAHDLARLVLRLRREPFFRRTVDRQQVTLRSGDRPRTVVNRNPLVRQVPWVDGVKTGHTLGAGYVLIGSGTRRGVSVVSVVLGEPSEAARARDTLRLLRYGLSRYRRAQPLRPDRPAATRPIADRGDERVDLLPTRAASLVTRRGAAPQVRIDAPAEVEGPLARGERVGFAEVVHRGETVARVPLVTARAVPSPPAIRRLASFLTRPLTLVLLGMILASVAILTVRRRGPAGGRRGIGAA